MPGLVPDIHVFASINKTWMAGTSPAMTKGAAHGQSHNAITITTIKNLICHHADAFGRARSCRIA